MFVLLIGFVNNKFVSSRQNIKINRERGYKIAKNEYETMYSKINNSQCPGMPLK
jgi:hypothetical protein